MLETVFILIYYEFSKLQIRILKIILANALFPMRVENAAFLLRPTGAKS